MYKFHAARSRSRCAFRIKFSTRPAREKLPSLQNPSRQAFSYENDVDFSPFSFPFVSPRTTGIAMKLCLPLLSEKIARAGSSAVLPAGRPQRRIGPYRLQLGSSTVEDQVQTPRPQSKLRRPPSDFFKPAFAVSADPACPGRGLAARVQGRNRLTTCTEASTAQSLNLRNVWEFSAWIGTRLRRPFSGPFADLGKLTAWF